jgi:integrase
MTLGQAVRRYVEEHLRPTSKPANLRRSEWTLGRLARLLGEERNLAGIGAADVAELKARLGREGVMPGTANRYLALLRALLRKASREWAVLDSVPLFKLHRLRNERTRVLSPEEELRLFQAAERNPPLWRLLRFLLATGARLGEARALTWDRVIFEHPTRRPHVVFVGTKNGSTRSVPLTPAVVEMLRGMRSDPRSPVNPHVFLSRSWGHLGPYVRGPFTGFERARTEAGLEDFRIHDLRHTCASRLVQAGVPLYTVGKLLGHRTLAMTARYAHLADDGLDAIADLLS